MMQSLSLTDTEPIAEISDHAPACLERLEFGKFCVHPGGPVEKNRDRIPIEYSQLGRSAGFPDELIAFCHPKSIGISEGDEPLPPGSPHGTVLRPVFLVKAQTLQRVFYRVRMRAEEGTDHRGRDKTGRRYTMARYLVAGDNHIDPLMLFNAMHSVPLQGITRKEASDISALTALPAELKLDGLVEAFLSEAVIYVLSGIPLGITEEISEAAFFSCVTALWRALPPALRSHLSAGWSVGNSYSGKFALTHTAQRAADVALFSPSALTWSHPDYVTTWDEKYQPVRSSFFEERLEPGRLYVQHIFGKENRHWSVNLSLPPDKVSKLIGELPPLKLQELPDWHDRITIGAFRYPGIKVRDQTAFSVLEQWLKTGKGEDHPLLFLDARSFTYQSTRLGALDLILKALAYPVTRRRRGDSALWRSVSGKCPDSFTFNINGATGDGSHRARFMAALAHHDTLETLRTLMVASKHEEAGNLSEEVASSLETCLDDSLRQAEKSSLQLHAHLLKSPPAQYRRWVHRRALHLMSALASLPGIFDEEVYGDILEINGSRETVALNELINGVTPPATMLNFVSQLPAKTRNIFLEVFNQQWQRHDGNVAARRERLLVWFRTLKPQETVHPLLRLELGEPLLPKDINLLADEVEQDHILISGERQSYIPPSLVTKVSAWVLENWELIGRRVMAHARLWSEIHALWPSLYARALVGAAGGVDDESVDPAIRRAAEAIKVPFDILNDIIQARAVHTTFGDTAPLLWKWALLLTPRMQYRPTVVDLCSYISRGVLPELSPSNAEQAFDALVWVTKESGSAAQLAESSQRMWDTVSRDWHVLLLLRLFPDVDFKPFARHLDALVRFRDWLREHLSQTVHPQRWSNFNLATQPFHSLSFREHANLWRDDFTRESVIWAVFKGVPVTMLPGGALRAALRAYSGADTALPTASQNTTTIEEQANMCLTFLRAYEGAASEDSALDRVIFEFVLPLLSAGRTEDRVKDIISIVGMNLKLPDYDRKVRHDHAFRPELYLLLRTIVPKKTGKMMMHAISEYYKMINR